MLMGYVNDLLDLRQINTGLYQRKIALFDPNKEVFDLIIEMFRVQAEMRNIKLTFDTVSFLELADNPERLNYSGSNLSRNKSYRMPQLKGDQIRLQQILINLLKFALKKTRQGSIKILGSFDQGASKLVVHIIDTGEGFNPSELSHLTVSLEALKVNSQRITLDRGTDRLDPGLMIAYQLIMQNNGELTVTSQGARKGTIVKFTLEMESLGIIS